MTDSDVSSGRAVGVGTTLVIAGVIAALGLSCSGTLPPTPYMALGRRVTLAEAGSIQQLAWSRSGRYLALNCVGVGSFADFHWVAIVEARTGRRVTASGGPVDVLPVWAPDDRFLYFSSGGQLVRVSVPEGVGPVPVLPLRTVFPSARSGAAGSWLSKEELLVTISRPGRGDRHSRIAAVNVSKREVQEICTRQEGYRVPIASPSGMMVAWAREKGGQRELAIAMRGAMDHASIIKGSHRLLDYAWGPDGRWLVYSRRREDAVELCRLDLPSRQSTVIARHRALGAPMSVSACGLVAVEVLELQQGRVHIYDFTSGRLIAASPTTFNCGSPAWSPDGLQLGFVVYDPRGWVEIRVISREDLLRKWTCKPGASG